MIEEPDVAKQAVDSEISSAGSGSASMADNVSKALKYVVLAAFLYALAPTVIDYAGSADRPLTVGAGLMAGYLVFTAGAHHQSYRRSGMLQYSYRQVMQRARSVAILLPVVVAVVGTALAGVAPVAFTWSTTYIDTAVTASLYETWPILWLMYVHYLDNKKHGPIDIGYRSVATYVMMFLALPAMSLVVFSTYEADGASLGVGSGSFTLPWRGIALALIGPVIGALATFAYLFTDRVLYGSSSHRSDNWKHLPSHEEDVRIAEDAVSMVCVVIAHLMTVPIILGLAIHESGLYSLLMSRHFIVGAVAGLCINGPAMLAIRRAHFASERREVISVQYLAPIGGLFFLWIFRGIDIARMDFLLFGTGAIVALNVLLNVDPENPDQRISKKETTDTAGVSGTPPSAPAEVEEKTSDAGALPIKERHSLKALVVALLTFGIFVYFRPELIDPETLIWQAGDYWAVLALASTVFALLLAFRLTRVEALLVSEDHRTLTLVRRIELLPSRLFGLENPDESRATLLRWIRTLNRADSLSKYRRAYNYAHIEVTKIVVRVGDDGLTADERREIAEIRSDLDALGHGRQGAREFAERIALWLIGGLIVVLCLAVPEQPEVWAQLLADAFAIVLAAVVIFLLFHLADVRRSRGDELLRERDPEWRSELPDGLYVRFRQDSDVRWQKTISSAIILGLFVLIFGLLAWDRLGF